MPFQGCSIVNHLVEQADEVVIVDHPNVWALIITPAIRISAQLVLLRIFGFDAALAVSLAPFSELVRRAISYEVFERLQFLDLHNLPVPKLTNRLYFGEEDRMLPLAERHECIIAPILDGVNLEYLPVNLCGATEVAAAQYLNALLAQAGFCGITTTDFGAAEGL